MLTFIFPDECLYFIEFTDKVLLLRYLHNCEFDVVKAENLLHKNLKFRKKCPALFKNRDVSNDAFQEIRKVCQVFPMPKSTPEGYEILIFRLVDSDPAKFVTKNALRSNVTMLDGKFLTDNELINGAMGFIDLNGFSFRHFLKAFSSFSLQNTYGKFIHQGTPFKPVRVHVINYPSILKTCMSIIGPRVRRNYMEIVKFHDDVGAFTDAIPKEYLPNEFGGTAGSCDDIHNNWVKVLEGKR